MTSDELKEHASMLGFDDLRIAPASPDHWDQYRDWIAQGHHGGMKYLANRAEERRSPTISDQPARSIIVVAKRYLTNPIKSPPNPFTAIVSRYAVGDDYHDVMGESLKQLTAYIDQQTGGSYKSRWCVDSSPVMEKDFAAQSGIGWYGKQSNIINSHLGAWFFLGAIITTLELVPDHPIPNRCGTCIKCIEACPTKAIIQPYVVDARRCISYLTIENKGPIPVEFRRAMGQRVYGCDDCLAVCPWNRFAQPTDEPGFQPREILRTPNLIQLMKLADDEFRTIFKGSPIKRTKRRGLLRNAAIALGNTHDPGAIPVLLEALRDHEPLIRGHAAWALGEIGGSKAAKGLQEALAIEQDEWVISEIQQALR